MSLLARMAAGAADQQVVELRPEDHDWHSFQHACGVRFQARHRVFALRRGGDGRASDAAWVEVNEWLLDEMGWLVDGWHQRDALDRLGAAVWRFRVGQEAEADLFCRRFVLGDPAVRAFDGLWMPSESLH